MKKTSKYSKIVFIKTTLFLLILFNPFNSLGQIKLSEILNRINYPCRENAFAEEFKDYIETTTKDIWEHENTESNYRFKNISIGGLPIRNSYIRVKQDTKELFRLNLNVLPDETDLSLYHKVEDELIKQFGNPILMDNSSIWIYGNHKIETRFRDISNIKTIEIEKYMYTIRVEPIQTYYVDPEEAIVEYGYSKHSIPQIEYFRIDNDNNVYIKERDKKELIKIKNRTYSTPKGEVISFDGGMFCYRSKENDIVYIKEKLAITYPIIINNK